MVVTFEPSACTASMVQDFTDLPSTCTTQAPHWLVSQPTWVPVMPRCSRRNWTSNVRASTLPETDLPLTVMATEMVITLLPHFDGSQRGKSAPAGRWPDSRKPFIARSSELPIKENAASD